MTNYKSKRPIDGKPPIWVIVDEDGKVVNRDPSKEELKGLGKDILTTYIRDSTKEKGDNFEELTCIWRSTISTIPVKNMNKYRRNTPIDHSLDSVLGIIQTKGRLYDPSQGKWDQSFKSEHRQIANGFKFDVLIMYCASRDGKDIERVYIFPTEKVLERTTISIYKNPKDKWGNIIYSWYDKYRVTDKKTLELVNKIWRDIIENGIVAMKDQEETLKFPTA
jgi:hypothetical protein